MSTIVRFGGGSGSVKVIQLPDTTDAYSKTYDISEHDKLYSRIIGKRYQGSNGNDSVNTRITLYKQSGESKHIFNGQVGIGLDRYDNIDVKDYVRLEIVKARYHYVKAGITLVLGSEIEVQS